MSDRPGEPTATVVCPECGSENIERLDASHEVDYRCLDCGTEFNEGGTQAVLP